MNSGLLETLWWVQTENLSKTFEDKVLKNEASEQDSALSKLRSLRLCPLATRISLEENPYVVPHFKALISGQKL